LTGPTRIRLGRIWLIVLAAFAIGLPVIVVIVMERNGPIWPSVPILLGSWVVVLLIIRSVILYKTYVWGFRKQRETARQNIGRLEARIEEAEQRSRDNH